ncbi:MAG TPA: radical SAM protein, partial [Candidatus Dormibacteraeota bacterium]|nr:radical SAM protein [Candidatus Dormibacteraeota bacterium]
MTGGRRVLLVSLYDLGRQPFALASAAAFLGAGGHEAACLDVAIDGVDEDAVRSADAIAVHLPMHTATRLAVELAPRLRALNPAAPLCFFGLYAPMNAELLLGVGAAALIGGEVEVELVRWVDSLGEPGAAAPLAALVSTPLGRLSFLVPDRRTLPPLARYARLTDGGTTRVVGYTEATRGCRHLCRHCPVVPVYGGVLRAVGRETVLADVAQQVAAGAQHITFGDPDFFNGPEHGMRIVRAMHERFPDVTYDVTIKVEHLLRHRRRLPELRATGCLFVTSAVEAVDDAVLGRLDKGHTRADVVEAVHLMREVGLRLDPT